jgi:cytoskeletal protein CcmA (bactofilin family)
MFGSKDTKETRIEPAHISATPTMTTREKKAASVIGEGVSINGKVTVEGTLIIHGELEGALTCSEHLIVGKTGRVKADLEVGSATIGGWVEGRVFAKERVELETSSHLKGDVHSKSFVIQDGCFFQGNCTMGEAHEATRSRPVLAEVPRPAKAA